MSTYNVSSSPSPPSPAQPSPAQPEPHLCDPVHGGSSHPSQPSGLGFPGRQVPATQSCFLSLGESQEVGGPTGGVAAGPGDHAWHGRGAVPGVAAAAMKLVVSHDRSGGQRVGHLCLSPRSSTRKRQRKQPPPPKKPSPSATCSSCSTKSVNGLQCRGLMSSGVIPQPQCQDRISHACFQYQDK